MSITYNFNEIITCNMCGSDSADHKVIGQRLNKSLGLRPKKRHGIAVSVMKCKQCGLHYPNPLPVPENVQNHYNIPPSEYWTDAKKGATASDFSDQINKALRLLGNNRIDLRALDIGVGQGKSMYALSRSGFDVYGIEPSAKFREFAINTFDLDSEKLKLDMVEDAEFPEDFFDFITFGAVLEHLYA